MPDGPQDPSIPAGWEKGVRGWDGERLGETQANGCDTWHVVRHLLGPRRWGVPVKVGKPLVSAFYKGNCEWELILYQESVETEYVLYEEVLVSVVKCNAAVSETVVQALVGPEWRAVRTKRSYTLWQTLKTIVSRDPSGLPCGEEISHVGVPADVREAADAAAREGERARGKDIPVAPPKPKPPAPAAPAPAPGPGFSPVPPGGPEAPRWFWVFWALGGWILVPDPPWEPPGEHKPPYHGHEHEIPFVPEPSRPVPMGPP